MMATISQQIHIQAMLKPPELKLQTELTTDHSRISCRPEIRRRFALTPSLRQSQRSTASGVGIGNAASPT